MSRSIALISVTTCQPKKAALCACITSHAERQARDAEARNHLKVAACCVVQAALSAAGIEPSEDPVSTSDFEDALRASFGVTPYLYCEHGGGRDYINEVLHRGLHFVHIAAASTTCITANCQCLCIQQLQLRTASQIASPLLHKVTAVVRGCRACVRRKSSPISDFAAFRCA